MTSLCFLFPALGGALFGYDIGATSGALVSLTDPTLSGTSWFALDPIAQGAVVSCSLFGALAGSLGALVYGDRLGRRRELLIAAGCYCAGSLLMAMAPSLAVLLAGHTLYGIGIGFAMHGAGCPWCAYSLSKNMALVGTRGVAWALQSYLFTTAPICSPPLLFVHHRSYMFTTTPIHHSQVYATTHMPLCSGSCVHCRDGPALCSRAAHLSQGSLHRWRHPAGVPGLVRLCGHCGGLALDVRRPGWCCARACCWHGAIGGQLRGN